MNLTDVSPERIQPIEGESAVLYLRTAKGYSILSNEILKNLRLFPNIKFLLQNVATFVQVMKNRTPGASIDLFAGSQKTSHLIRRNTRSSSELTLRQDPICRWKIKERPDVSLVSSLLPPIPFDHSNYLTFDTGPGLDKREASRRKKRTQAEMLFS